MTAFDFAGFCKDKNLPEPEDKQSEASNSVAENWEYRYSLRYGEFIALNTHMIQKLYKKIQDQQEKIEELEQTI